MGWYPQDSCLRTTNLSNYRTLVRVLQRSRANSMCVCVCVCVYREQEGEVYFKELAHVIVRVGKFKICRTGPQAGDPG